MAVKQKYIGPDTSLPESGSEKIAASKTKTGNGTPVIYIGPALPHGKLNKGTIFSCSKEKAIKFLSGVIEQYPSVPKLIVPICDLAKERSKMESGNGYLCRAYAEVQATIAKNKEV